MSKDWLKIYEYMKCISIYCHVNDGNLFQWFSLWHFVTLIFFFCWKRRKNSNDILGTWFSFINFFWFKIAYNFLLFLFSDEKIGTLDGILDKLYCRSQMYLSRQMARLRPELTMPMFSGNLCLRVFAKKMLYFYHFLFDRNNSSISNC